MFTVNSQLVADTFFVTNLKICRVLLMNNANYPWLILVPKIAGAVELTNLNFATQQEILHEINVAAKVLQKKFNPHKLNIGALGNIVQQLHIHIIARQENDACFPKPVWGQASQPYNQKDAENLIEEIKNLLQ